MRCVELFEQISIKEDAEGDLAQHAEATKAMHALMDRLRRDNESTPLAQCPGWHDDRSGPRPMTCINARALRLPYPDLRFGFISQEHVVGKVGGFLRPYHGRQREDGSTLRYDVIVVIKEAPAEAVDVAWSAKWDVFIHEMIHYLEYKRGYERHAELERKTAEREYFKNIGKPERAPEGDGVFTPLRNPRQPSTYYNHDLEANAHFQQGLYKILNSIVQDANKVRGEARLPTGAEMYPSFKDFDREFRHAFSEAYLKSLNKRNRRRFEQRFYALWKLCHDRWPNIGFIKDRLATLDAIAARLAAEDSEV